jgi:tripartite-type tricarboxylate transporter receptor subunit TctC
VLFDNGGVFTSKTLTGATGYSIDDYRPLCGIVKDVNILVVNRKTTGCSTFEEFLAKYSGTGESFIAGCATGGIPHVCLASLFNAANINYKQVAYNGASEISAALLGGHIDVACLGGSEISIVKDAPDAAILVAFANKTPEVAGLENVPAIVDYGFNIDTCIWRMLLVPKDTPDDVFNILYKGFTDIIKDEKFVEFAKNNGLTIDVKEPAEVTSTVKAELAAMIPVFKELKLGIYSK